MSHISQKQFEAVNCLPTEKIYNQCVNSIVLKYFDNQCPQNFQQHLHKTSTGQNALYFIRLALWNKVPQEIKRTLNINIFKYNLKKHY